MNIIEEFVTCGLCIEIYDDRIRCPRMLSCGHSFCTACIRLFIGDEEGCPMCRTAISAENPDTIPINYSLMHLTEQYIQNNGSSSSNNIVEKQNGSPNADHDGNFIPAECLSEDIPSPLAKEGVCTDDSFSSVGLCEGHKVPKRFRCKRCKLWICGDCVALSHKYCKIQYIEEAIKEMRQEKKEKIQKHLHTAIKIQEDLVYLLDYHKKSLRSENESTDNKTQKRTELKETSQVHCMIEEVLALKTGIRNLTETLENKVERLNDNLRANEVKVFEEELEEHISEIQEINETINKHKHFILNQEGPDFIADKKLLMFVISSYTKVYLIAKENETNKWGNLEWKTETLRIRGFQHEAPPPASICLPVVDQSLNILTGSNRSSQKVFIQFTANGLVVGEVIIRLKQMSDVLLQAFLGLKGSESFRGKGINYRKTFIYMSKSNHVPTNASSHALLKAQKKTDWKEGEVGLLIWKGKDGIRFSLYIWIQDGQKTDMEWVPAGVVDQGMDICKSVLIKRKMFQKVQIADCGVIVD